MCSFKCDGICNRRIAVFAVVPACRLCSWVLLSDGTVERWVFHCSVNVMLAQASHDADCACKAVPTSMKDAVPVKKSWATPSQHQCICTPPSSGRIYVTFLLPPSSSVPTPCGCLGALSAWEPRLSL